MPQGLWKIPTCLQEKGSIECRTRRNTLQHDKSYMLKPTGYIIENIEKSEAIPLKSEMRQNFFEVKGYK